MLLALPAAVEPPRSRRGGCARRGARGLRRACGSRPPAALWKAARCCLCCSICDRCVSLRVAVRGGFRLRLRKLRQMHLRGWRRTRGECCSCRTTSTSYLRCGSAPPSHCCAAVLPAQPAAGRTSPFIAVSAGGGRSVGRVARRAHPAVPRDVRGLQEPPQERAGVAGAGEQGGAGARAAPPPLARALRTAQDRGRTGAKSDDILASFCAAGFGRLMSLLASQQAACQPARRPVCAPACATRRFPRGALRRVGQGAHAGRRIECFPVTNGHQNGPRTYSFPAPAALFPSPPRAGFLISAASGCAGPLAPAAAAEDGHWNRPQHRPAVVSAGDVCRWQHDASPERR